MHLRSWYNSSLALTVALLLACAGLASGAAQKSDASGVGDTLSGRLPPLLRASESPYYVVGDITVGQGRTVIIEAGTVLLFNSFTALKVQGTLLAKGTSEQPVVFTSVNEKTWNPRSQLDPAPYDWNGIQIFEEAVGTSFSYCTISYSVFGIMSATRFIRIEPTLFRSNGRGNLSIEGTDHQVGETPYEYGLSRTDAALAGVPMTILKDPLAAKRNSVRYIGVGAGVAGFAFAAVYTGRFIEHYREFKQYSTIQNDNLLQGSNIQWQDSRKARAQSLAIMSAAYTGAIVGSLGLVWSFTF